MEQTFHERHDDRIIIHFDYDCFYASVIEQENPTLKGLPLAVQQKHIIVTCNYVARQRGLRKLQLISEAKKVCPDVVIVLGEDLTRFRNASKLLYQFFRDRIWSGKVERLGFDEVWLDCTSMVDYNYSLLNQNDLKHSFFCLDQHDPTVGFEFDASCAFGPTFPPESRGIRPQDEILQARLSIASHLARHLRHQLEELHGYTATVGVSTNKLLSKLAGNVNKPKSQTTLMPPYESTPAEYGTPVEFMDGHDIRKVPGIGFMLSQKLCGLVLQEPVNVDRGNWYGGPRESVSVKDVRQYPGMSPKLLEETLSGPGSQRGIGGMIWALLHGVDDSDVAKAKRVPSQISIEDSYLRLDTLADVKRELLALSQSLIKRMRTDLTEDDDSASASSASENTIKADAATIGRRRWLAHPRTLRLSTRPKAPLNPDGTRSRSSKRISRSCPVPNFVFSLHETEEILAERLVHETLISFFRKLHPERDWNLSLLNIAVTNMIETAADSKESQGRDIGRMFQRQGVKEWSNVDEPLSRSPRNDSIDQVLPASHGELDSISKDDATLNLNISTRHASAEDINIYPFQQTEESAHWEDSDADDNDIRETYICSICQWPVPILASGAHRMFHDLPD